MQIIWQGSQEAAEYETARWSNVFNLRRPDRHPTAIIKVESEADVVGGVRLASQLKLSVSVRSGGHSFEAWSVQNDTILLDLGGFKAVRMNQATLGVSVTPSVTSKELDDVQGRAGGCRPCPAGRAGQSSGRDARGMVLPAR